jgi:hypothetical protein
MNRLRPEKKSKAASIFSRFAHASLDGQFLPFLCPFCGQKKRSLAFSLPFYGKPRSAGSAS